MYESELNSEVDSLNAIPRNIRSNFVNSRNDVEFRSILPWGEHCTECNWPTCYSSCELYSPRTDGACRLFLGGVTRIDLQGGLSPYIQRIRFKRWAKLWTLGNPQLLPLPIADDYERKNIFFGKMVRKIPLPKGLKKRFLLKYSYIRRNYAQRSYRVSLKPDEFLVECYNPNDHDIELSLTFRARDLNPSSIFQKLIRVPQGYYLDRTPASDIMQWTDLTRPHEVEILPNECSDKVLYFGLIDFIRKRSELELGKDTGFDAIKWKCIVWDLDNTLWDGILIEDGPEGLRLNESVVEVIKETDRRGILHSIASKNNEEDALLVLRSFGIDEYFIYPQISWRPKSESIARIAHLLNIGIESVAFIDDQEFEREEVRSALPQVAAIDAKDAMIIPGRPECQVPVTEESKQRRLMYRQQEQRESIQKIFQGDYEGFLRECNIQLRIEPLSHDNIERVYELAQRTNQMNFSGNRYPKAKLEELMASPDHETYVMRCSDRFGSYGIIGFALVAIREPRLIDLMFSCRIQSKRVDHAFFSYLLGRYVGDKKTNLYANYRRTAKNDAAGKVFEEVGFDKITEEMDVTSFVFKTGRQTPDEKIVSVITET